MERKELGFFDYQTEAIKLARKLKKLRKSNMGENECRKQVIKLWKSYLELNNLHKKSKYYSRSLHAPVHFQVLQEFKEFQEIVQFLKLAIEDQEKSV